MKVFHVVEQTPDRLLVLHMFQAMYHDLKELSNVVENNMLHGI
jgi:hypothetical protein